MYGSGDQICLILVPKCPWINAYHRILLVFSSKDCLKGAVMIHRTLRLRTTAPAPVEGSGA